MKLDSKYFDSIRVSTKRERTEPLGPDRLPRCQWKGCEEHGSHRAPRGRGKDGQYYLFCMEHVRQYNAAYNYFDGMNDTEVQDFQKDALTGHRPTWKVGVNASAPNMSAPNAEAGRSGSQPPGGAGSAFRTLDPHAFFARRAKAAREQSPDSRRQLKPLEKKSLQTLNLAVEATRIEIKSRFKELVKIYHPDANGGDARSGDKLREIIQAYNYLKQAGLV